YRLSVRRRVVGRSGALRRDSASAQPFERVCALGQFIRHIAQFVLSGTFRRSGGYVLCGASQLEKAILQRRDLCCGQDDRIGWQAAAFDRDATLIRALPARLAAVLAFPSRVRSLLDLFATPAAVCRGLPRPRTPLRCFVT